MYRKLRDIFFPGSILGATLVAMAWTLSAFSAPLPVFQGEAVVITALR